MSGHCNVRMNNQLGLYDEGRALPQMYKEWILNLHHDGLKQQNITDTVRVPVRYVKLRNQQHFSACYMSESTDLHRNYHRHLPSSFQERKFPTIKVKIWVCDLSRVWVARGKREMYGKKSLQVDLYRFITLGVWVAGKQNVLKFYLDINKCKHFSSHPMNKQVL